MDHGSSGVTEGELRLSRAPSAELAAAALRAQQDAGLEAADFIVVAVRGGEGPAAQQAIDAALEHADRPAA